jgi:hypothetical protein
MIKRIVILLQFLSKMNDSLYILRCSNRSCFARYTVILITSRDCNHITWFRNSASVSLLATLSHNMNCERFFIISTLSKAIETFQIALFENFFTNENFSFLLIFCMRNRHSTVIENYIERDDVISCELDHLVFIEIWFIIELHKSLSSNALIIVTKWFR